MTKLIKDFLYEKETKKIREACQEIWNEFGGAFKEKILEQSLIISLKEKRLEIENQKRINIYFKDKKVGTYIPDLIINNIILIELKCKPFLTFEDKKQFWHYLKASPYKVGFLINFSPKKLEIVRRIYDKARRKKASK